jgi:hypothetical protein
MLDPAYGICAWMLFPSGVTSWSGDDWRKYLSAVLLGSVSEKTKAQCHFH